MPPSIPASSTNREVVVTGAAIEAVLMARGKWPPPFQAAVVSDDGDGKGPHLEKWDEAALGLLPTAEEIATATTNAPSLRAAAEAEAALGQHAEWRALCGVWLWERTGKQPTAKEIADEWATFRDRFVQIYKALA